MKRGGGTLVASRLKSDSGSTSIATVPSAYARLSVMRTKSPAPRGGRCRESGGRST
jgi:hypothetical protein